MSDFLSKFDKDHYQEKPTNQPKPEEDKSNNVNSTVEETQSKPEAEEPKREQNSNKKKTAASNSTSRNTPQHEVEIDPAYRKKQERKKLYYGISAFVVLLLLCICYYFMFYVKVPNFTHKQVVKARTWTTEKKVNLKIKQVYSVKYDINQVLKQNVKAGKRIRKGKTLLVEVSKGPNPDEKLLLPDFKNMKKSDVKAWIKKNKADNLVVMEDYSDKVAKGHFISIEFSNKDRNEKNYRRKDRAIIHYSKGKEVYEKDIAVPDFTGKPKSEVESWAKNNEINVTYKESDSNTIEQGSVISQSIKKDSKIAKKTKMEVMISKGKAIVVPDFSSMSMDQAKEYQKLSVQVKENFSDQVPYGSLISQSVPSGTKLFEKDSPQVAVIYSVGKPYLYSYKGKLEGDLASSFYNDYQSKGANIRYTTYYVDSAEEKGTVVEMSTYNEYVPTDFVVQIGISKGNLKTESTDESSEMPSGSNAQEQEADSEQAGTD